jgi:hypothetical protein
MTTDASEVSRAMTDLKWALVTVMSIYRDSDGEATKRLYQELHTHGAAGFVAVNLFRALKSSERAKLYRGHGYKSAAYDRKQWSIDNLAACLVVNAEALGIRWGWLEDPEQRKHNQAIYLELPNNIGQVSFHTGLRTKGPDYDGVWDGARGQSPPRVCRYVVDVLNGKAHA